MRGIMKYNYPKKYRKAIKKAAIGIKKYQKTKDYMKNPIKSAVNGLINRASELDTKRKAKGSVKDRVQVYNSKTKRFIVKDTKTGKILRNRSKKGTPYKGIRIA